MERIKGHELHTIEFTPVDALEYMTKCRVFPHWGQNGDSIKFYSDRLTDKSMSHQCAARMVSDVHDTIQSLHKDIETTAKTARHATSYIDEAVQGLHRQTVSLMDRTTQWISQLDSLRDQLSSLCSLLQQLSQIRQDLQKLDNLLYSVQ